ncbi:hypothetical protein K7X08_017756 [Anisodus acutangulus]|uniref:Uncharacterized protein n=1 Tax=Anisodus acutangulus TaxID=402998 RepID=A0A9Q1R8B1_9SOLA|nr:hypothetical protein K7X08_017756 [Anisodus acutangulus]
MNEQQVENLHNTNKTNEVLDDKHEEDGQRAKEMEVVADVDSGTVADDVGVFMQSKELNKGKDKVGDDDWTMPLMDNFNTSAYEVSTQSMESFDEKQDDSGQQIIYMDDDQNVDIMVASTPVRSSSNFDVKSGQKGGTSVKSWADMAEEEGRVSSPPTRSKLSLVAPAFVQAVSWFFHL